MKKLELKASLTILATALILTACGGNGSSSEGRLGSNNNAASDTGSTDQTDDNTNGGAGGAPSISEQVCSGDIDFEVTGFTPESGQTGVDVDSSVRITFNADIEETSANDSSAFLQDDNGATIDAEVSVNGNALLINPTNSLQSNTDYTVNVLSAIAADCENSVTLGADASSSFQTGNGTTEEDSTIPDIVFSTPEDLNGSPLPVNLSLIIDFSEPLDSSTVSLDTIFISPDGGQSKIDGTFSFDGSKVVFTPSEPLNGNTSFDLIVLPGLTDLSGNPLGDVDPISFITGGITAVIDGLDSAAPGNPLSALLTQLVALSENLQAPGEGGLPNPDELIIIEIFPFLVDGNVAPEDLADLSSVLVAVCDPKEVDTACTLSLDIAFGSFNEAVQQDFANALTSGDVEALGQAFLSIGELVFSQDGGLVSVELLDDNGLPLPEALEAPIVDLLNQIGQVPVIGALTDQGDLTPLLNADVLKASVANVEAGQLLELVVIPTDLIQDGIDGDFSLLQGGGSLIDALDETPLEVLFDGLCQARLLCPN